jgi:hypothetical protein
MSLPSIAEREADRSRELPNFQHFSLPGVREKVAEVLSLIGREGIFSTYTVHNISHIDSMLAILDWLVPESTRNILTPVDWLLTVLAIYLHDLGLLVTANEFVQRQENPAFVEWFSGLASTGEGRDYVARARRMSEEEKERFFFQEFVRKGHAARIREWITGRHSRIWGHEIQPLASAVEELLKPLPSRFREYLGTVCESHHEDNLHLLNIYPLAAGLGNHRLEIVNVQYAAVLLRSADLLHVTKDRTPSVMYQTIRFSDPKSVTEWDKQLGTFAVRPKGRRLIEDDAESAVIVVSGDFTEENPFFSLQEYLAYADQQIKQSKRWIDQSLDEPDGDGYSFPWSRIEGDVRLEGVPPVPLRFQLDRGRLLDLLVGHTLYNDPLVAVRELLQNSIDAVRYQHHLDTRQASMDGRPAPPIGRVVVGWNSTERVLTVEDNGIGMNRDAIDNHLMRVGASFYQDAQALIDHPDFTPISRFGIGILTSFMVSDDIEVITYRDLRGYRLRMTSVHASYALRELTTGDDRLTGLEPHGTRLIVRLRDSVDLSKRSIEDIVRHWIILPECSVEYVEDVKPAAKIGFTSVADAVRHFAELDIDPQPVDGRPETIIKTLSERTEAEGTPINTQYELGFVVRHGFHPERVFAKARAEEMPAVCIEGIRVSDSLPGFEAKGKNRLAALLSVRGSRRFRTTVSRSGLEHDDEYVRVARICASLLFQHVRDEVTRIVALPGRPLSQASSACRWLRSQLINAALEETRGFVWQLHNETPSVVLETMDETHGCVRSMISNNEVDMLADFWTLEARLLDLLGTISRDLGREVSLNEFLAKLAPDLQHFRFSPLVPDAAVFNFTMATNDYPEFVEVSRQHQYSAVRWLRGFNKPSQLSLRLDSFRPDYIEMARRIYSERDPVTRDYGYMRSIDVYAAPIRGDAHGLEGVVTDVGIFLSPGSPAQRFWTSLRDLATSLAETSESQVRFADVYMVAATLADWIREPSSPARWFRVWGAVSDDVRQTLEIPRNVAEIITGEAIFRARSYWRDWAKLGEE